MTFIGWIKPFSGPVAMLTISATRRRIRPAAPIAGGAGGPAGSATRATSLLCIASPAAGARFFNGFPEGEGMDRAVKLVEALAAAAAALVVVRALDAADGWWLNSGLGVLRTSLALSALGLFAAVWPLGRPWARAGGVWAGAMVEMTVLLFRSGPGTIWPIVMVFAASISAGAVFAGAWVGAQLSKRLR